ncbi:acyl transferase domain-containing protein [Krasilnikovia cinnamomea]|uniref:Acyl transferase domain-containing protein n=1 Tax=Krasilnikovia cinnamomea TaxID=349313 RepID=A0A4Q7ZHK9_9ACTN|nr:type I polyketide synthase [Krasilnikovia cinnamomea]RZU50320.1 acyl transferase domain-containing protein [Krasilnikovia cinnamomea]
MSTALDPNRLVIAVTGGAGLDASPYALTAAVRAGALGVLDLGDGDPWSLRTLADAARRTTGFGVRVTAACAATPAELAETAGPAVHVIILTADSPWPVAELARRYQVLVEVTDLAEARAAEAAGAHGLVARGMESGGRVSELSAFVLLQQLVAEVELPVWVAGGIGPSTAVASVVGGAAGVLLDTQLLLLRESTLVDDVAILLRRMDGTEVVTEGGRRGLRRGDDLLPIGQDGWLAAEFARRWPDTTAAVHGVRDAVRDAVRDPDAGAALRPGAPLARTLGVDLPVAQGPMTRVSDEAAFAAAVADAGALPFIALALANAEQSRRMLTEAAAALGDRPWGVGVLGFAPDALRAAQIEIIQEIKPAVAIIAGGRPAQAKGLEAAGISAFLHVPSPGLLRQFLQSGSRKFIFEGAECGGHVGPRASFPLWEAQLAVLTDFLADQPAGTAAELQIFFAGGIHDERSAAMVAALAGPLTRRGAQVGVLMGTAYLFTAEAVTHGAIQPLFQQEAVEATGTALLETAPGHATRCLPSGFVDDFHHLRDELSGAGVENRVIWEQLELLNVGRLRIASKGLRRDGDTLAHVDDATQAAEGLFMAGQVAVLRHATTTVADLHAQVTTGATALHAGRVAAARADLGLDADAEAAAAAPLDIAIVGMACVFPGSPDLPAFWNTVLGGKDVVREVSPDRWDPEIYYAPEVGPGQAGRITVSKWGGFIDPVPFDAIRYGIPPAALASIDPTQLLALEISHRALVDAGYAYDSGADHSRTGVVFGAEAGSDMSQTQTLRTLLPGYLGDVPEQMEGLLPTVTEDTFPGVLANVIAGRVANRLDLGGPNYTVDAACASSLAAMDAACKELTSGHSDLMICGGADLHNGVNDYLMFTSAHALSPTGRCRTFDSTGDGIALGEGVAAVVLKRLADAERDGDRIYAVVKGLGGASDGRALGLTAPRAEGQRRALDRAYASAGVTPDRIGLVEAHGTGTVVGDRTELETLTRLFTESGARPGGAVLGSVKSQIGHTKCAAGMAGVIKAALALHTGVKPPTINLTRPNPAWSPDNSPFAFHTEARPWAAPAAERLAGVSAFGFGGTNFHVVLSAHAPTADPRHGRDEWPAELFLFRGTDRPAARRGVQKLLDRLGAAPDARLRDLAAGAARESDPRTGAVRIAIVASDTADLADLLRRALQGEHDPRTGLHQPPEADGPGKVAFLFPGQGSQRPGALADLFVAFPELRQYLQLGREYADLLFPPTAFDEATEQAQADLVRDTRVAQPVLGIGGLAADHVLRRLGVRPDMAGGHSYGELVALCTAGAFDPATLLELSRERAAAILGAAGDDPGTMAAVGGTAEQVTAALDAAGLTGEVVLANHNGPNQVVVSGPTEAVGRATTAFTAAGLRARAIPVACAFHSPVVAGGADTFAAVLAGRRVTAPTLPVWSNRSAEPYPADAGAVRDGLAAQIGAPVRFVEQIEAMYAAGARIFVEAGPGQVLGRLVADILGHRPHRVVAVDGRPGQGLPALLTAVAELACAGVPVQTGWLYAGRDVTTVAPTTSDNRPIWTVDGQVVRDRNGDCLPGGMTPARRIEEFSMTAAGGAEVGRDSRGELVSEFLRTSRDLIASQRDVLLAFLGDGSGGRLVWQPDATVVPVEAAPVTSLAPMVIPAHPELPDVVAAPAAQVAVLAPAAPALDVQGAVLTVISERTGYPEELIELDLDLEADLSVDSIKRAEVAGEVANRLGLSVEGDESELEDLVKARTVRAMVSWLDTRINVVAPLAAGPAPTAPIVATVAAPVLDVQGAVLTVISERTGYPEELIELDLDLEADLSVDSIKRAEVAGEVANRLGLSVEGDESELEDLVKARTVRAMVSWLDTRINGAPEPVAALTAAVASPEFPAAAPAAPTIPAASIKAAIPAALAIPAANPGIAPQRLIGVVEPAPVAGAAADLDGARFLITGGAAAGAALAGRLAEGGATGVSAGMDADPSGMDGIVLLDGLTDGTGPLLPDAFGFVKRAVAALTASASRTGPRWLIAAGPEPDGPRTDGLPGLFRTLAREYPEVVARYVRVPADATADDVAEGLVEELRDTTPAPVVYRRAQGRQAEQLVPTGLGVLADGGAGPAGEGVAEAQAIGLDADSVVVLIGGARGITPWFARTLAGGARCRIELVGRTPLPQTDEDPELAAATDKAALRATLARRGMRSPADIDRTASGILAAREVAATVAELSELGADVRYHSLDVRDDEATHRLIKRIHDEYGRIDGLVYAAGIIEDKLIADKDPESFARVFRTKVDGAQSVLDALAGCGAEPRFVVLFGSIAAAYGNRGQSDYAAANDALDTMGARWSAETGHRALTVHWGPWAPVGLHAGMVSPELTAEYARRGIGLIDPEEGALSLLRELAWGDPGTTSVVYTASGW